VAKRTPFYVAASLSLAVAGAACSNSSGAGRDLAEGTVTIEGCLTGGTDGRVVLTAAPDAAGSVAARVGEGGDRETHSYVLLGGDNLQAHIGKRVEVAGTVVGDSKDLEQTTKAKSEAAPASGDRDDTPTVTTKEEIDVEIRQLNVANVRELAPTCNVNP
jgi:hypothetical protein